MFKDFTETWKGISKEKVPFHIMVLMVFNVVFLLIANIIAVKTVNLTSTLGYVGDSGIRLFLPAAVIVYVLGAVVISDLLCELDQTNRYTRVSCHIGFLLNLVMVVIFLITAIIPGVISGTPDNGFDGGFWKILGSTPLMLLASMISFYFGDLLNDKVFKKYKLKEGLTDRQIVKRCVFSTMAGQAIDASIFITLGLHVFPILLGQGSFVDFMSAGSGNIMADLSSGMGWLNVLIAIALQWTVKVLCEFVVSPLILKICHKFRNKKVPEEKIAE